MYVPCSMYISHSCIAWSNGGSALYISAMRLASWVEVVAGYAVPDSLGSTKSLIRWDIRGRWGREGGFEGDTACDVKRWIGFAERCEKVVNILG